MNKILIYYFLAFYWIAVAWLLWKLTKNLETGVKYFTSAFNFERLLPQLGYA